MAEPFMKQLLKEKEFHRNLDEPGRPRFCVKGEPGEGSERSCAFDGARVVLMPITDAVHLIHGPIACAGNSWDNRGARSSGSQLYRRGFSTDLDENNIVFGGEKRLYGAITELAEKYRPAAIFVYATCVTAMIGDDVEAVCHRAAKKLKIPVIPVNAPGLLGDKNIGNRLAGEVLLKQVIGTQEPENVTPFDINLIGEYNIAGDLWSILPLLNELGIRVLSCISGDARFEDITKAHRAKLNVIVCSKSLITLTSKMQKRYGMPYMEASFYGITDTNHALRNIAQHLSDPGLIAKTEKLIKERTAATLELIEPYKKRLSEKSVVLFTGGVKTWSMINALKELGMNILAGGTQNSTVEDFRRMKALMDKDAHIIADTSSAGLLEVMYEKLPDVIVAGGKTKYLALKTRRPFLDINHGRSFPYAGYEGMVTFAKQLDVTVNSPIWKQINAPAPWERSVVRGQGSGVSGSGARRMEDRRFSTSSNGNKGRLRVGDSSADSLPQNHNGEDNAEPTNRPLTTDHRPPIVKAAAVNPQKNSPALGATLAFMGIHNLLALLHGSQGCSTFIRLQLSRHFKEPIPLNCTSMSQDTAIFGGWENLKQGLSKVAQKFQPEVIGVMTSGLTETMGDDVDSAIAEFRKEHPEFNSIPVIAASTPDYCGSLQEGYARAVEAAVRVIPEAGPTISGQVNLLVGSHLTPGDIETLKDIVESFGLQPLTIPDLAGGLDGHIEQLVSPLARGGISLAELKRAGQSEATIVIGESLYKAAALLRDRFQIPVYHFDRLTGLESCDLFMSALAEISGVDIPAKYRRHRSQLMDAMADYHYEFGNRPVSLALEGDLAWTVSNFLIEMGCKLKAVLTATTDTKTGELPSEVQGNGDLEDLETLALGSDLLIANSNGRQALSKLGNVPLLRAGVPIFDEAGASHKVWAGYKGTMNLLFETANLLARSKKEAAPYRQGSGVRDQGSVVTGSEKQ